MDEEMHAELMTRCNQTS